MNNTSEKITHRKATCLLRYGKHSHAIRFIEQIEQLIERKLSDPHFGVPELAEANYLSVSQLNRRLNKYLGVSAGLLIRRMRMQQALVFLQEGRDSVGEIAWRVGYDNPSNFTRSFKDYFGEPPSALMPG